MIDYRLLRAVVRSRSVPSLADDAPEGLSDEAVAQLPDTQSRYDAVIAHYLGESISLSRAAELLGLAYVDLRIRLYQLEVPLRLAPASVDEAREDVTVTERWLAARES